MNRILVIVTENKEIRLDGEIPYIKNSLSNYIYNLNENDIFAH